MNNQLQNCRKLYVLNNVIPQCRFSIKVDFGDLKTALVECKEQFFQMVPVKNLTSQLTHWEITLTLMVGSF